MNSSWCVRYETRLFLTFSTILISNYFNIFFCHSLRYCQLGPNYLLWLLINETVSIRKTVFRCACGFQKLVGTSAYGGHNLYRPGFNRVKVAAKTLWGPVLMSPCPQTHLYCFSLINTVSLINNHKRYFGPS